MLTGRKWDYYLFQFILFRNFQIFMLQLGRSCGILVSETPGVFTFRIFTLLLPLRVDKEVSRCETSLFFFNSPPLPYSTKFCAHYVAHHNILC